MGAFWVQVVLVAGAFAAIAVLVACGQRSGPRTLGASGKESVRYQEDRGGHTPDRVVRDVRVVRDTWMVPLNRCEQAVHRASRAVEAISSVRARRGLSGVVHRMAAELPNVRALVELGRGLEAGGARGDAPKVAGQHDMARHIHQQLAEAATRFGAVTDALLVSVLDLVAHPDLCRLYEQTNTLRDQFPLLRPMSAILGPDVAAQAAPAPFDTAVGGGMGRARPGQSGSPIGAHRGDT
ncbi:hypothetical protein DFQ14_101213 [Halopolyspora algeriensis]|uniref:Uncharacterized protein n=1 Tax=Halopolyspora algeriensis TaxID=1500506 RepID=A0A368W2F9_9ACTN|nr:hypothetical protein [Halopolyspora algeriensis]RCW46873.1 hypothetical protein DFQ14_101213 [Halopolyspora algeriensis]TQM47964.1 hypothetical protein FHU43_2916 [Halopolyspora algeriensis]